jgi:hypothetical protein
VDKLILSAIRAIIAITTILNKIKFRDPQNLSDILYHLRTASEYLNTELRLGMLENFYQKPVAPTYANGKVAVTSEERDILLSQGKIPAIKAVRDRTHLGLKESKDIVENYISEYMPGMRYSYEDRQWVRT